MTHNYKTKIAVTTMVVTLLCLLSSFSGYSSGLSGTYTINAGASASSTNYKNFSSAISDLLNGSRSTATTGCVTGAGMDGGTANGPGVSGPVTFLVQNSTTGTALTYAEYVEISKIIGASATNTITFQGAGLNGSSVTDSSMVVLTNSNSSSNSYVVYLDYASYVTFKNITIKQAGTSAGDVVQVNGSGSSTSYGCTNDNFLHCQLIGASSATTTATQSVIYLYESGISKIDTNIVFRNNLIQYGSSALYLYSWSSLSNSESNIQLDSNQIKNTYYYPIYVPNYADRLKITNNIFTSICSSAGYYGMYLYYCSSPYIVGNTMQSWTTAPASAIYMYYCSGTNVPNSTTAGARVMKNNIYLPSGTNTQSVGVITNEYSYNGPNSYNANQPTIISNNMITVGGSAATYGIYSYWSTYTYIMDNSISFTNTSTSSYGIYTYTYPIGTPMEYYYDNIVNMAGGEVFYTQYSTGIATMDYNDLKTSGSNFAYNSSYGTAASGKRNLQCFNNGYEWLANNADGEILTAD